MQDVGDREIVVKRGDHQHHGREKHNPKHGDACATCGSTKPFRSTAGDSEGERSSQKCVCAEGEGDKERKTAYLGHVRYFIFSETNRRGNSKPARCLPFRRENQGPRRLVLPSAQSSFSGRREELWRPYR